MEKIILIGGGGHCKVVIDTIQEERKYSIIGIIDLKERIGEKVLNIPIVGDDGVIKSYFKKGVKNCFITVGNIGNPKLRLRLFRLAEKAGFEFPNIIHPCSVISKFARLGSGNYIAAGVIINAGAVIDDNCIINTGATIEHDCRIGDFVHIGPGAKISGGVDVGRCTLIGTGSLVKQCLKIGKNSIIGTGGVVVSDIDDNVVAVGNPCRKIKKNVS